MNSTTNKRAELAKYGLGVSTAAVATTALISQPAMAQGDIAEVESTVQAVGGVAAAAVSIVLGAMGVRFAIKQVNRVSSKA